MFGFTRKACRNILRVPDIRTRSITEFGKRLNSCICSVKIPAGIRASIRLQNRSFASTSILHQKAYVREFILPEDKPEEFKHLTGKPSVRGYQIAEDGKYVDLHWDDGSSSRYHSVWLRFNCRCPRCIATGSNSWIFPIQDVPLNITIRDMTIQDDGSVNITWNEEDHKGVSSTRYLKKECYSDVSMRRRRDEARMTFPEDTSIPNISWTEVQHDEKAFYRWLRLMQEPGICLLKDVPTEHHYIRKIVEMIGYLENSFFGEIWEVKSEEKPFDPAYSPSPLAFHMDLCVYEGQHGLSFIHCLRFDDTITGGYTIFVDMFHVAELFRQKHPNAFRTLSTIPNTFRRLNYVADNKIHMVHRRPIIQVNDEDQIIRVSWHGHEQGPPLVNQENVEEFYQAFQLFAREIVDYPYVKSLRLKPTDVICYNNRRFSHARTSYDISASGVRLLQGCTVKLDDFRSRLTVLANKYGDPAPIKAVGNGDWT